MERAQIVGPSNALFLRYLDMRYAVVLRHTFRERTIHNIRIFGGFKAHATRSLERHNSCDCGEEKRKSREDSDQSYYTVSRSSWAYNREMVEYERYGSSLYTLIDRFCLHGMNQGLGYLKRVDECPYFRAAGNEEKREGSEACQQSRGIE